MRLMAMILIFGMLAIAGYAAYTVRTATHDPEIWHIDPLEALPSETPNTYRVAIPELTRHLVDEAASVYAVDARTLAAAFDAFVVNQPRVERVAGSVDEAWITYVQRTPQLLLPDYISVRFYDVDDAGRSTVAIYSRSRYGYGDLGVNEARVKAWLESIASFAE